MRTIDLLNATTSLRGLAVAHGLAYGSGERHRMDVYRPERGGDLPVVVWFYGGGWQWGERAAYRFVAASLARHGFVVVVPDYRLYPQARFPAFLEDGAAAVAEARRLAPGWGGDAARLFAVGHSAGAYIAAMLAVAPDWLDAVGVGRAGLAGAVGIAGPYDFLPITGADIRAVFAPAADDLRRTQPIHHVDGANAPLLLLHGGRDTTCYPRNSLALAARIRAAGGPARAKIYGHIGHIGIVAGFAPLLRFCAPTLSDTVLFLRGGWEARAKPTISATA
jgi:acetyl esterase/lipase